MRENINDELVVENRLLSDENLKLRKAYSELLNEYLQLIQNKMPQNHIDLGQKYWESKIG
jgi:hypothetical protein